MRRGTVDNASGREVGMRSVLIGFLALLLAGAAGTQTKRPSRRAQPAVPAGETSSREAADRAAIQKLQQRDIAAHMAYDVDALQSLWTDDGVLLLPHHPPIVGRGAIRKFFEQQGEAMANVEVLGYEEQWQEVRIVGDYAYQWGQIQQRTRKGQVTAEEVLVLNAMRILKRDADGDWSVARAIWSEASPAARPAKEPTGEKP